MRLENEGKVIVHIYYVILSPTFGMHQYTADLANRQSMPGAVSSCGLQLKATVLTLRNTPIDRFAPWVNVQPMIDISGTGLQRTSFKIGSLLKIYRTIVNDRPDVVHFTGPHIWNPILLWLLRRAGIPTIHTIHDLDPHSGTGYGRLLYAWNGLVVRLAKHILVHGQVYRDRLISRRISPGRVTWVPLLHLFLSYASEQRLAGGWPDLAQSDRPYALFFARLEAYKGVAVLIDAMRQIEAHAATSQTMVRAIIAGKGDIHQIVTGNLPSNVEIRERLIGDDEAIDLFSRCSVVVLPYLDATQSALIAAAYFFGKPVIVTRSGALPEYVVEGETGWVIEPGDAERLARCLEVGLSSPARLSQMGQVGRAWYQAQRATERETLRLMYEDVSRHGKVD